MGSTRRHTQNLGDEFGFLDSLVRVSTLDQADHGVSLEAQSNRIRDWCAENGYVLDDIKVDRGLSGGRADNRPALQEALASVRRGDVLVVYSLSRLARSTRDTLEIADALEPVDPIS